MAARMTRANLAAAVAEQGFVVAEGEAALLRGADSDASPATSPTKRQGGGGGGPPGGEADGATPQRSGSGSGGGHRWVTQLQALTSSLGGKAKDSIDRGRIRIAHRRVQSLGASSPDPPADA